MPTRFARSLPVSPIRPEARPHRIPDRRSGSGSGIIGRGDTLMAQRNLLGNPLEICSIAPMTGFYRDGYANTGPGDTGSHTVCAVVSEEFLEHQRACGNDLTTPRPTLGFPGLKPGDRWAVCASRWQQSFDAGVACGVVLAATNEAAVAHASEDALRFCAVDVTDEVPPALM